MRLLAPTTLAYWAVPLAAGAVLVPGATPRGAILHACMAIGLVGCACACKARAARFARERAALRWIRAGLLVLVARWGLGALTIAITGEPAPGASVVLSIPGNLLLTAGLLAMPGAPPARSERLGAAAEALAFALAIFCLYCLAGAAELGRFVALSPVERLLAMAPAFMTSISLGAVIYLGSPRPRRYRGVLGLVLVGAAAGLAVNLAVVTGSLAGAEGRVLALAPVSAALLTLATTRPYGVDEEHGGAVTERLGHLLPHLPTIGLLLALFYRHATGGLGEDRVLLWLVYPLVAIFLVRHVLALDALQRLSHVLEAQVAERSRALAAAQEGLQRRHRLEALGRLAGGVAHDFNNLLAGISAYAHLVTRHAPAGAPAVQHAEEIDRAVERGAALTRQILTFARRQRGEAQRFEPAQLVGDMRRLLASVVGDDVRLDLELAGSAGHVRMDPGQLEQVVMNLVLNAREATHPGGRVEVKVGSVSIGVDDAAAHDAAPGRYVVVEVSDDGAGMAPEVQARLFEPFFTTKGSGHGAGLGLATSYGIVRQAGGFFTVDSAPGRGSRFAVHLPASAPPEAPIADAGGAGVDAESRAPGARGVLLVDDSPPLRASLAAALRAAGYRVLVAASGAEAVDLVRRRGGEIDVLVTDVVMPGMTGIEAAREIREVRPDLRVVIISGFADVHEDELPEDAVFLAKPFAPPQLVEKIGAVLGEELRPRAGAGAP
jgi:signal transduction histidine kinase